MVARTIVEHLQQSNWVIERGAVAPLAATPKSYNLGLGGQVQEPGKYFSGEVQAEALHPNEVDQSGANEHESGQPPMRRRGSE